MSEIRIDKNTRWECQMCGECCKGPIISKNKNISIKKDGKWVCRHLDEKNKLCSDYNNRPWICRIFPFVLDMDKIKEGEVAKPKKAFDIENLKIHSECKGYGKGKRIYGNKKLLRSFNRMGNEFAENFKKRFEENKTKIL